jgi:ribonuclease PH
MSQFVCKAVGRAVCLDKYPKSLIEIYITVVQNDGSGRCAIDVCGVGFALSDSSHFHLVFLYSLTQLSALQSLVHPWLLRMQAFSCLILWPRAQQ